MCDPYLTRPFPKVKKPMESALGVVSDWATAKSIELSTRPCNVFEDDPTEQAYEIKQYIGITSDIKAYLAHLEFEELLAVLMTR